jgi:hypothetical protein
MLITSLQLFVLYGRKDIYEVFVKLSEKRTNCILLLILSVPGGTRKCFVRDSGTRGKQE